MKKVLFSLLVFFIVHPRSFGQEFELGNLYKADSKFFQIGLLSASDTGWNLNIFHDHKGQSWEFDRHLERTAVHHTEDVKRKSNFLFHYQIGDTNGYVYEHRAGINDREIWLKHDHASEPVKLLHLVKIRGEFPTLRIELVSRGILLWYSPIQLTDEENSTLQLVEYSAGGNQLFNWEIALNKPDKLLRKLRLDVHDGNVFLTTKEFEISPVEKRAFKANYRYVLYLFPYGSDSVTTHLLHPEGLFPLMPLIKIENDELLSFCFAGKKNNRKQHFLCETRINTLTSDRTVEKYDLREMELPRNSLTYRWMSRSFFGLRAIGVESSDSSWTLTAEFRDYRVVGNSASGPVISYLFGPIALIRRDPSGLKLSLIEKYQHSANDNGTHLSYFAYRTDSSRVFVHTRSHRYFLGHPRLRSIYKQPNIQVSEVSNDDLTVRVTKLPTIEQKIAPHWRDTFVKDQEIVVPVSGKKLIGLGKLRP